jgi:excisionase family DNA binding protein
VSANLLTTKEAARLLRVSHRTMEEWRCRGGGPPFIKLGRRAVRYCEEALQRFIFDSVQTNTASPKRDSGASTLLPRGDP